MGLDVSFDAWHGPYSQFMRWRIWIAANHEIPLKLMEGFYSWEWDDGDMPKLGEMCGNNTQRMWYDTLDAMDGLRGPIGWSFIRSPLVVLLHHSDCDGRIRWWDCKSIAIELGRLLRRVPDDTHYPASWSHWRDGRGVYDGNVPATKRFIAGCLAAWKKKKDLRFG